MRSSWLLLKVFRRKLWVCLFLEFMVVSFVCIHDARPGHAESLMVSVHAAFVLAFVLSLVLRVQTDCNRLPFPVTLRQRAWLPMIAFATLWAVGAMVVFMGLIFTSRGDLVAGGTDPFTFILPVLGRLPLYGLVYLAILRIWHTKPQWIAFVIWLFIPAQHGLADWYQAGLSTYPLWWPVALGAIVYYIWEAPLHLAHLDRLHVGQGGGRSAFPMRDMNIATRRHPLSWAGDIIEYTLFLVAIVLFVQFFLPQWPADDSPRIPSYIRLIMPAVLLFSVIMVCKSVYQQARCCELGKIASLGAVLAQMTVILIPLVQGLWLRKKGIVSRCERCHMQKFIWQPECPHCATSGPGMIRNKSVASLAQGKALQVPWPLRVIRKIVVPLQLFLIFGLMAAIGNEPFVSYHVSLVFGKEVDTQAKMKAIEHIRDWVESHPSPDDWAEEAGDSIGASEDRPARFRLDVTLFDSGSLWVKGFGLRWDHSLALPEHMARHLANEVEGICSVRLLPAKQVSDDGGPPFWTRSYLDNRLHWHVIHAPGNDSKSTRL